MLVRCRGNFPVATLQSLSVTRIAAGQNHHTGKLIPAQQGCLVHRAPKAWSNAWDGPGITCQIRQPIQQLLILCQSKVVEEGVAPIKQTRDASTENVMNNKIVLFEVQR